MSIDASVKVLARLLEHEAFRVQVAADPDAALAGLDLSADERRLLAAAAALRERDRRRADLFADLHHDLRAPLTLLRAPLRRLLDRAAPGGEQARDLAAVQRSCDALRALVDELLDLSRLDAGKLELSLARVDVAALARLVASHFELAAADRGLALHVDADDPVLAEVDPDKLARVLTNLLTNAVKFTPDGGVVVVDVRRDGERAVLRVADSGPGVPPAERARVFDRFHRGPGTARAHGGAGLGLAIVRDLVALHRGDVAVSEAPEGGARFTVRLPLRAPAGAVVAAAPGPAPDLSSETAPGPPRPEPFYAFEFGRPLVLVVENDPDMRAHVAGTLATAYNIVTAADGEAGLRHATADRPDLVLTDLVLPVLGGDQLLAQLRARPELDNTPVVILTARADPQTRVRLLRAGASDYLTKPFAPEELMARVANQIAARIARELLQRELGSESRSLVELAREANGLRNAPLSESSRLLLADLQRGRP